MVRCRLAIASDLDEVAAIWHDSASQMDGAPADMPSRISLRARIDEELASGWTLYVADYEGIIVGMLAVDLKRAILDQLFVAPPAQGQDVGRTLLQLAMRELQNGFRLRTSSANIRAKRFYEKAGLKLLEEGIHHRTGAPVCFYIWSGLNSES